MGQPQTSGITLDRAEFLVLMDAAQAQAVAGLDTHGLVPSDREEHRALVARGIDSLKRRGALRQEGDVNVLDAGLFGMATVVAHPEVAVITRRDTPGLGQQLFLHYRAGGVAVEQTLPSEHEHRLALLTSPDAWLERMLAILPVQPAAPASQQTATLSQDQFLQIKHWIEAKQESTAREALRQRGLGEAGVESLVAAIARPQFGGTVAALSVRDGEAVDARNLAVVQGPDAAWLIRQATPGEPTLTVGPCRAAEFRELLSRWWGELTR